MTEKQKQTQNWSNIIWREWRNTPDAEYAQQLFDLVADDPLPLQIPFGPKRSWRSLLGWLAAKITHFKQIKTKSARHSLKISQQTAYGLVISLIVAQMLTLLLSFSFIFDRWPWLNFVSLTMVGGIMMCFLA